jgi:hypothetical protein
LENRIYKSVGKPVLDRQMLDGDGMLLRKSREGKKKK